MTDTRTAVIKTSEDSNLDSYRLASIRTDFAVIRTGFTIASFGAGITEFIGRNTWPDWTTNVLAAAFIVVGMTMVQSGLNRSQRSSKALFGETNSDPFTKLTVMAAPRLMQLALLALLLMVLFY